MSESSKNLETSQELAQERTELAQMRSDLAQSRTLQAAERTYAAWIRTGFTIAGAGWTLGIALKDSDEKTLALFLGGALILMGMLCFVYAWMGVKAIFDYIKKRLPESQDEKYPTAINFTIMTILSVVLFLVFAIGFGALIL